jgi:large subunit ribosomal protein L18
MDRHARKYQQRLRRRFRVSNAVRGNASRPRLCIFKSLKHMYAQIIDDTQGKTVASASTLDSTVKGAVKYGGNKDAAAVVGKSIAERAIAAGVKEVCFDRREFRYHGRVKALAEAAREAGLSF